MYHMANVQCCICTSELIELITEDASRMDRQSKFSNFRICLVAKKLCLNDWATEYFTFWQFRCRGQLCLWSNGRAWQVNLEQTWINVVFIQRSWHVKIASCKHYPIFKQEFLIARSFLHFFDFFEWTHGIPKWLKKVFLQGLND